MGLASWFIPPWVWGVPWVAALSWLYGGGVLCLFGWLRDRKYRKLWLVGLGIWIGHSGLVWQLLPRSTAVGGLFRIGSFNMDAAHYKRPQIERLADSLAAWHPTLLCLQEVYLGDYTPEAFAKRLGYRYQAFLNAGGATGMLVLSDLPILRSRTHLLLPGSTNGLQEVHIQLPDKETLRLFHIHFPSYRLGKGAVRWRWTWLEQVWQAQREFAECLLRQLPKKGLYWICGDFNALPYHPLYVSLVWRGLRDGFWASPRGEGPSWRYPWLRIDYIWGSQSATAFRTRWVPGQAHAYLEGSYAIDTGKVVPLRAQGR